MVLRANDESGKGGGFADPAVEESHLFWGVEPVFAAGHDRELRADPGGECGHCFGLGQEIAFAVQDAGRDGPSNGMPAHVAEPVPGERLAETDRDFLSGAEFVLRDVCLCHHVRDQVFHVHDGRDEQRAVDVFFRQRGHGKERADAVRDQCQGITT